LEAYDDVEEATELDSEERVALVFKGNARDYFRLWIVNLCLTLFTLGLFSAWAKVRRKRYFYSHTELEGTPFEYLGNPIPILKGRLIAALALVLWYVGSRFFPSVLLLPFGGVALFFLPWVMVRTAAFNARYSAYRNMTFHFNGSYRGAVDALLRAALLAAVTCGLGYPWAFVIVRRYFVERTSFGDVPGTYRARGGQLVGPFLVFALSAGIASSLFVATLTAGGNIETGVVRGIVASYGGYALVYGYLTARLARVNWRETALGPVEFFADYRARDLMWIYASNALAIIASLGLLIPWATIRMYRYRIERLHVLRHGSLDVFAGTEQRVVAATGAEVADLFDFDLSL
jgi:uncharacterized membrane protein YjgN (DUF898 family)